MNTVNTSSVSFEDASKISNALKAIANARRLQIMSVIISQGEVSVQEIDNAIDGLSQSPISQHLARLREQGIVKVRKSKQNRIYSIASPEMRDLIEHVVFNLSFFDEDLREACDVFTSRTA